MTDWQRHWLGIFRGAALIGVVLLLALLAVSWFASS